MPLKEFVDSAIEQGCEIRTSKFDIVGQWGVKQVRYLYNPKTDGTYDITDFDDGEFIAPSSIHAAERRLGIKLTD